MHGNRGSALIAVLTVMAVLSVGIGSVLPLAVRVLRFNDNGIARLEARSYAHSGLEAARAIIAEKRPESYETEIAMGKGRVHISVTHTPDGYKIISEGKSGTARFILKRNWP